MQMMGTKLTDNFGKKPDAPKFDATIDSVESPLPHIRIVRMSLTGGAAYNFRAGQYITLTVGDFPPRFYSLAAAPGGGIEIHIKDAQNGGVSTYAAQAMKAGDRVTISHAQGSAVSEPRDKRPVLAIAGGVGITQVKAIVEDYLNNDHPGPVHLFWGAAQEEDLYLKEDFVELSRKHPALSFIPVVGDVTEKALELFPSLKNVQVYICGRPEMVRAALPLFAEKGAQPNDVRYDPLPPEKPPEIKPPAPGI